MTDLHEERTRRAGTPIASSPAVSERMSSLRRRDTQPELLVRRQLHAAGLRYRVCFPVPGQRRRTIDIAFTKRRLAVFIDGCFWHGCPVHGNTPKANQAWWVAKIERNRTRDADTSRHLNELGWYVLRFWEHESPEAVAFSIRLAASQRHEELADAFVNADVLVEVATLEPKPAVDLLAESANWPPLRSAAR